MKRHVRGCSTSRRARELVPTDVIRADVGGNESGLWMEPYRRDTTGQRMARVTATCATAYIGATEATDPDTSPPATGEVPAARYYSAGLMMVAMRDNPAHFDLADLPITPDTWVVVNLKDDLVRANIVLTNRAVGRAPLAAPCGER